jgi:CBS domain-containing protein
MRPITARDLMNPEVLTVGEDQTLRELADFLLDNEISGAPVVDGEGGLVGVVSMVDLVEAASDEAKLAAVRSTADFLARGEEAALSEEELHDLDESDLQVGDIMSTEIHSVAEDATVSEVAMKMLKEHLHRLLVLRDSRVVGIVSTSDLLGLLVDEG